MRKPRITPGMTVIIDPEYERQYETQVQQFMMLKLRLTATVIEINAPEYHEYAWVGEETAHIKQGVIGCFAVPTKWLIPAEQRLG